MISGQVHKAFQKLVRNNLCWIGVCCCMPIIVSCFLGLERSNLCMSIIIIIYFLNDVDNDEDDEEDKPPPLESQEDSSAQERVNRKLPLFQ